MLSRLWDVFFIVKHTKSSVWSLEGLLPLSSNFYKNFLYLLTKLSTLEKISLHASVYNNAASTEAAMPSLI